MGSLQRPSLPISPLKFFFLCIYSRFSIFCLNVWCFLKLFAQLSLIRYVYNNPERIVCFLKKILQGACADIFHEASIGQHCWGSMQTDATLLRLRFAGHRTIEMLGLVTQQVPTSANIVGGSMRTDATLLRLRFTGHRTIEMLRLVTQQVPTLLWFHANGRNKSQHCWVQQYWVLLANNVGSVCMGFY